MRERKLKDKRTEQRIYTTTPRFTETIVDARERVREVEYVSRMLNVESTDVPDR